MKEAKILDPNSRSFTANGNEYFIGTAAQNLTPHRYSEYQKLRLKFECGGLTWGELMKQDAECEQILMGKTPNKDGIDVIMVLRSRRELAEKTIKNKDIETQYALMLATLFINRGGEDVREWNEEKASDKISDWLAEGIALPSFFLLTVDFLKQLIAIFSNSTDNG